MALRIQGTIGKLALAAATQHRAMESAHTRGMRAGFSLRSVTETERRDTPLRCPRGAAGVSNGAFRVTGLLSGGFEGNLCVTCRLSTGTGRMINLRKE